MGGRRSIRIGFGAGLMTILLMPVLIGWPTAGRANAIQGDAAATATRGAETAALAALRTEVADLRTRVAALTTPVSVILLDPLATGTPTPIACGQLVTNFNGGAATADDVTLDVLQTRSNVPLTPPGADVEAFAVEVSITNASDAPLPISMPDFRLTACDGRIYGAVRGGAAPAIVDDEVVAGDQTRGWITFALPRGAQPARFDYHLPSGGRLGQRLTTEDGGVSGGVTQGCAGAPGADAVGANATGGDGADGGDAVGGDAVGGDASGACQGS